MAARIPATSMRLDEELLRRLDELGAATNRSEALRLVVDRYFTLHDQARRRAGEILRAHPKLADVGKWIRPEEVKTIVYTMPAIALEYAGEEAAAQVEQLTGIERLALYDMARAAAKV